MSRDKERAQPSALEPQGEPTQRMMDDTGAPTPPAVATLVALAMLEALVSFFLWTELVRVRSGGQAFCPLEDPRQCSALWDVPAWDRKSSSKSLNIAFTASVTASCMSRRIKG